MKTADEYIKDIIRMTGQRPFIPTYLDDILTKDRNDHIKEILSLIDEMIRKSREDKRDVCIPSYDFDKKTGWVEALTELKEKIEKL